MNAPENITSLRHEITQHLASTGEATAKQIAEAVLKEKVEVARALNDMHKSAEVEREKKRGNEYVYWLSAAAAAPKKADAGIPVSEGVPTKTYPPETLRAMIEEHEAKDAGEAQWLAPEDYEMPPADPALLAMANKMLGDRLDGVAHVLRGCGLPLLADASGTEDLQPKAAALAGAYQMALADLRSHEACLEAKDAELLAQAKVVVDLRDRLDALTQQWEADTGRITADLQAALKSRSQAINEADRLRGELAAERQAREALQEQDGVDVTDAAVGYLIRVPKRAPILRRKPESARSAALGAVRAGAARAEVLAVVPVGVARRGAEWQASKVGD